MINFKNTGVYTLRSGDVSDVMQQLLPMLIEGEMVFAAFQDNKDKIVFTTKRVIVVNSQGLTGKKKNFTSLPYSKIQAFSFETAGMPDPDCGMDLFFLGLGHVRFVFTCGFDIVAFNKIISRYIL